MVGWTQFSVNAEPGVRIRLASTLCLSSLFASFSCELQHYVYCSVKDFGGSGPVLLICNANGFHAMCYHEMAKRMLNRFHCYAIDLRGAGDSPLSLPEGAVQRALSIEVDSEWLRPSASLPTFEGHAEDICAIADHLKWDGMKRDGLICNLGTGSEDCTVSFKSLAPFAAFYIVSGGCAVLAALLRLGSRVKAAYIYEPVTVSPNILRESGLMAQTTRRLCKSALKRKYYFTSKEAAFEQYSQRGFKTFNKDMVWAYVNHGFRSTAGGSRVELKCSRECEAFMFALAERMSAQHFHALATITCPVTVGAGNGEFGGIEMANRSQIVAQQLGRGRFDRLRASHFPPFEDPDYFAERLVIALTTANISKL